MDWLVSQFHAVSLVDWFVFAAGVLGLLKTWLGQSQRLPANVRAWINDLGMDEVNKLIQQAEALSKQSDEARRQWVVSGLQQVAKDKLGLNLPDSIANLIVEQAYQIYKRAKK